MECQLAATGETVAVICAANRLPNGEIEFAPFAMLFNDNPYRRSIRPKLKVDFTARRKYGNDIG